MRGKISRRAGCAAVVLLLAIGAGVMMLPGVWQSGEQPLPYTVASVPGTVARAAEDALAAAGHTLLATPAWAGDTASWRDGARYRLFFAARAKNGRPDVHTAEVRADPTGVQVQGVRAVAETEAGEESVPLLHADWAAFSTAVDGYVQSVTLLPLGDTRRPEVYMLAEPAPVFQMQWDEEAPAGALLLRLQIGANRSVALNPALRQVSPEGALTYTPQLQGEFAWLPNLVSRVRELPGVGPEKIAFAENLFFSVQDWVPAGVVPDRRGAACRDPCGSRRDTGARGHPGPHG